MHILIDLIAWFGGVEIFWPLGGEINFWSWFTVPAWLNILLETGEFLAFGLYFLLLGSLARKHNTDVARQKSTQPLAYIQFGFFAIFAVLFFLRGNGGLPYTIFGALYLLSIIVAMVMTTRMRTTIEKI
jgi:hypothetical protein